MNTTWDFYNLFETFVLLLLQIPCCLQNPTTMWWSKLYSKFSFAIAVVLCCIAWQPLVLCCALLSFLCWVFHSYYPISSEGINQCRGELSTQAQAISGHLYKCINKKKGLGCFTHLFVAHKCMKMSAQNKLLFTTEFFFPKTAHKIYIPISRIGLCLMQLLQ